MDFTHERFLLKRAKTRTGQISFRIQSQEKGKDKALTSPTRLVYVVRITDEFLYVGEAIGALKKRLQNGFNAYRYYQREKKGRRGYKGYKWIELFETEPHRPFTVDAFIFSGEYSPDEKRADIEAIEGELVYLIRNQTGKWPIYQNEIHFNNKEGAEDAAKAILSAIQNKK
ncbi:MAG: hypothetical protein NXI25_07805 [bacterium]|nr:hypothetical protein [bacterium]